MTLPTRWLCVGALVLCALVLAACRGGGVRTPENLVGQPFRVAVDRYGPPQLDAVGTFPSDTLLHEYENGLYDAVLDTLAEGARVRIRHASWPGDPPAESRLGEAWQKLWPGALTRDVWAVWRGGTWEVVDAMEYGPDVQF